MTCIRIEINDRMYLEKDNYNVVLCILHETKKGTLREEREYFNSVADALYAVLNRYTDALNEEAIVSIPEYINRLYEAHSAFKNDILKELGGKIRYWELIDDEKDE